MMSGRGQGARRTARAGPALALIGLLLALTVFAPTASADVPNYDFETVSEEVLVTILKDGGVHIDYAVHFVNYGDMDGVDIGLPNNFYDEGSAWAYIEIDGQRYEPEEIRPSPYVEIGLAVEFTSECMNAAGRGRPTPVFIRFHVKNPHMVYLNELRDGTVGIRFRPTWFDPDSQRGDTGRLVVRVLLPEGHTDLNRTYHIKDRPWHSSYVNTQGRLMLTWEWEDVDPWDQEAGGYDVGVAFPKGKVDEYYEEGFWDDVAHFFADPTNVACTATVLITAAILVVILYIIILRTRRRMQDYFDPELAVEGAGPRRDLTAVEAAVVLEVPLDRVATMILFGMEKKELIEIDYDSEPLRLEKLTDVGEHMYETRYLSAIRSNGTVSRKVLKKGMVKLVEDVEDKIAAHGVEATRDYYQAVVERAWKQVESAGTPEEFSNSLKDNNNWMLIDEDYEERIDGLIILHHPVPMGGDAGPVAGGGFDVKGIAGRYVSNLRSVSSSLVSDMRSLTKEVTSVTHPIETSGGGGGFGGGGCACACACACAGGGR